VVILVVVGLIAAGWQAMQISKTATVPAPPAPKKVMKERIFPLEFLGGKDLIRGPGWIGIRKGGYATFRVAGLPIREDGKYEIVFHGTRKSTGRDVLLINNGKGNGGAPFFYETHPASDRSIEIAFFRQGMAGNAKYFYPTGNFLQLSADDDLLVQLDQPMYVKLKYME
jgi:hypothetical protein